MAPETNWHLLCVTDGSLSVNLLTLCRKVSLPRQDDDNLWVFHRFRKAAERHVSTPTGARVGGQFTQGARAKHISDTRECFMVGYCVTFSGET